MDNKFFGIDPSERATIPDAKRATGFQATQEPYQYINQALFELKTDHIIGTAAQLAAGSCTCKYQSSDQTLRDAGGTAVTLSDGDRVYIIGLDLVAADFDLSAYDRLRVTVDPSISLSNESHDLVFGDSTVLDIYVSSVSGVSCGSGSFGTINCDTFAGSVKMLSGEGIDFSHGTGAAGMSSQLLDDYEEGTFTPSMPNIDASAVKVGAYIKIGNVVHFDIMFESIANSGAGATQNITGLPFTCGTFSGCGVGIGYANKIDVPAGAVQLCGYIGYGSSTINLIWMFSDASTESVTGGQLDDAGCHMYISGSYIAA